MLNKAASFLEMMSITPSIRETVTEEDLGVAPGEGGRASDAGQPAAIPPPVPASRLCTPFSPQPFLRAAQTGNLLIPLVVQGFHLNTTSLSTSRFLMGSEGLPHRPGVGAGGGRSSPWGSTAGEELEQLGLRPCTRGCGLLMPQTSRVYD